MTDHFDDVCKSSMLKVNARAVFLFLKEMGSHNVIIKEVEVADVFRYFGMIISDNDNRRTEIEKKSFPKSK